MSSASFMASSGLTCLKSLSGLSPPPLINFNNSAGISAPSTLGNFDRESFVLGFDFFGDDVLVVEDF